MLIASFARLRASRRVAWGAAISGLLLIAAFFSAQLDPGMAQTSGFPGGVRVTGTLKVFVPRPPTLAGVPGAAPIAVPDWRVFLRTAGGANVAGALTMLDGRFDLIAPGRGVYQICWDSGDAKGCAKRVKVGDRTVIAEDIIVRLETPLLHGVTLTGDNRPCWISDSFFGLDVATIVTAGGKKVRANIRGEYAITGLAPGAYVVEAACEQAKATAQVSLPPGGASVNLPLPNHAPRLVTAFASKGSKAVTRAAAGSTVKVAAATRDPDGDTVKYIWRTLDGGGSVAAGNGATETWTLPAAKGLAAAYVIARDGRGGYAYKRIEVRSGALDLAFSGQVLDEVSRLPLANASVAVGDATGTTNASGWFSLSASPQSDNRYVLNITHRDYARISRVYDKDATGATYEMIRAQVDTLPASGVVKIVDRRGSGPCGGSQTGEGQRPVRRLVQPSIYRAETDKSEVRDAAYRRLRTEAALLAAAAKTAPCIARGVEIVVPAGALVDGRGNPASGSIRSESASLNPARRAIPGDYQAVPAAGGRAELLTYGAVYAAFTDSAGNRLDLKSGTTAEVRVPVPDEVLPGAPPTIALWTYDDTKGVWREEGTATLQNTPSGWAYVGQTRHFSEINMDVAGNDPAHATCVRVEIGSDFAGWSNLTLRAYVSYGGTPPPKVKETALDNHQYHAIFRIPFNTGFPNSLRLELRGADPDGLRVVLLDNVINTDAPPHHAMTTPDLWPDSPYLDCTPIVLNAVPGVVPPYGDIDGFGRPAFLAGPFGSFNPADGEQQAIDYYAALDVPTPKPNLGAWWDANGFDTNGGGVAPNFVQAAYMNHNDLGFGRNMHCLQTGQKLACYVTNYGLPDQNPQNANDALSQTSPGATVAMEYDPNPPVAGQQVQFFVYGAGALRTSGRLKFADLDGLGPKPVPALCQVCHGGGPGLDANHKVSSAHFREFDLPSFKYPGGKSWDYNQAISGTTPSTADFDTFARLNQMVRDTNQGNEIANTINGWYNNNFTGRPSVPPAPASWAGHASEYRRVYGTTCRTCHIARTSPDFIGAGGFDFFKTSYVIGKVCGTGTPKVRVMPNASITYRNFWADTTRVHLYEALVGLTTDSCKT